MSFLRSNHPIPDASMHADLNYTSLASSLFICLSLALILLGFVFVRSITSRHRRSHLNTTAPDHAFHIMSEAHDPSLPPPSADAKAIDLLPSNPLAGVYFPFTSGQLAALADKRATESAREGAQADPSDKMPRAADLNSQPEDPEIVANGYVRYFEDRQAGEAWQRKALVYDTSNQRIT